MLPKDSPGGNRSSPNPFKYSDTPFAKVNNDMILKNGETLTAHSPNLENVSETDQTMITPSFTCTQTDSVTTSTTHSTVVSVTTSAEMKFPFVFGSMLMKVEYDFSTTKVVESSIKKSDQFPLNISKYQLDEKTK